MPPTDKDMAKRKASSAPRSPVADERNTKNLPSSSDNPAKSFWGEEVKQGADGPEAPVDKTELDIGEQELNQSNQEACKSDEKATPGALPNLTPESSVGPDFPKNYYRRVPSYLTGTVGRPTRCTKVHSRLAFAIDNDICNWVRDFCVDNSKVLEDLSSEEKDELVKSLGGYCRQTDWNSLVDQLEPDSFASRNLHKILAAAILAKSIWEDVVKDPFFFLTEDCATMSSENNLDLFLPSRSQIHNMWRWCEKVNSYDAANWRRLTLFHLIETCSRMNRNPSLGEHTMELRDAALEAMARRMISESGPLYRFMKATDDTDVERRMNNMIALYFTAEQLCCGLQTQKDEYYYHYTESHSLYSPGAPHAKRVQPSWVHSGESTEKQEMKNRLVLFQFRPAVSCESGKRNDRKGPCSAELLLPATVVLSDYSHAGDTCSVTD